MLGLVVCGLAVLLIGLLVGVEAVQTLFVAIVFVLTIAISHHLSGNKMKVVFRLLASLITASCLLWLPVFAGLELSSVGSISYTLLSTLVSAFPLTFDSIMRLIARRERALLVVALLLVLVAAIFLPRDILAFVSVATMTVSVVAVVKKPVSNLVQYLY